MLTTTDVQGSMVALSRSDVWTSGRPDSWLAAVSKSIECPPAAITPSLLITLILLPRPMKLPAERGRDGAYRGNRPTACGVDPTDDHPLAELSARQL